jgi:hypothetical protein
MQSTETNHYRRATVLLVIAAIYASLNLLAVSLAAHGVIHRPWGILVFFTWLGPVFLGAGLVAVQFASRRRFSWPAALAFLFATCLAMLINLHIYGLALAAV